MSNAEKSLEPGKAAGLSFPGVKGSLLSAILWIVLILAVYLLLPRCRITFEGFGMSLPSLTVIVLEYAWTALPLIGIAAGVSLTANRSRRVLWFVLLWLPLILIVGLVLTVGPSLLQLVNHLS